MVEEQHGGAAVHITAVPIADDSRAEYGTAKGTQDSVWAEHI